MQQHHSLSIVIPVLNEEEEIEDLLLSLQPLRASGSELIVVDGGSSDRTRELAEPLTDLLLVSDAGRALQMNSGAKSAKGETLLFLHADTRLPQTVITGELQLPTEGWGFFPVSLSGEHWLLSWVEEGMNWRSLITSVATGDQALFCSRKLFDEIGGFPEIALMEDVVISKNLRKFSKPEVQDVRVLASSRRWEANGIVRTIITMWWLRLIFWLGCKPETIKRQYDRLKSRSRKS